MASDGDKGNQPLETQPSGFLAGLLNAFARSLVYFFAAFTVGIGVSAAVCLYYGLPIALSLVGGFIVLGIALVVMSGT